MGFMPGRSTGGVIFTVRQLLEKYETVGKDILIAFSDSEKVCDRVPRERKE